MVLPCVLPLPLPSIVVIVGVHPPPLCQTGVVWRSVPNRRGALSRWIGVFVGTRIIEIVYVHTAACKSRQ